MNFLTVQNSQIPEGEVAQIEKDGVVLWSGFSYGYVSLGDSIAAGHTINEDWASDYGTGSQYGNNGNKSTVIVPGSYTDLIRNELTAKHGSVNAKSFAQSGDTVADLMEKLTHDAVKNAIKRADLVTICIGANDVLEPTMSHFEEYVYTGDLSTISAIVEANLKTLASDTTVTGYKALFDKLKGINSDAKYVFTTIYNPYRFLWIEEGNNGFFAPLLNTIPDMTILGFDVDNIIKNTLLQQDVIKMLFNRTNGMSARAEDFVNRLNDVLRTKINNYQNPNFILAETKTLFDSFPDRQTSAQKHYNDLVNVEYTRGYDTAKMDWGRLWAGSNAGSFWWGLAEKYVSLSGIDISGLANDLLNQMIEKVIIPDVDPHPETYGHYALMRSFSDVLGWKSLDRHTITYHANGGIGTMAARTVVSVDGLPAFVNIATNAFAGATGYYFTGWNTKADGTGTAYSNGQFVGISSDITLYAQWSNMYKITYKHTNKTVIYTDDETGHMECYALWIAGQEMEDLGKFSDNKVPVYSYPYGTRVGVVVSNYNGGEIFYDDCDCDIYFNGVNVASGYKQALYEFTLTSDVTIEFQWKISGSLATFDACSWEDCYITTA